MFGFRCSHLPYIWNYGEEEEEEERKKERKKEGSEKYTNQPENQEESGKLSARENPTIEPPDPFGLSDNSSATFQEVKT